jgi:hypothetical protein
VDGGGSRDEGADGSRQLGGIVEDLEPGRSDDLPAGNRKTLVPLAIVLECGDREVGASVIGFDDQTGIPPEKVRLELLPADDEGNIDLGRRQLCPAAESKERALELSAGALFPRLVLGDCGAQPSHTAPPATASDHLAERREVEEAPNFRLGDRFPQLVWAEHGREVEQSTSDGGAWDPVEGGAVSRPKRPVPMCVDALGDATASVWGRNVDTGPRACTDPPEGPRGSMRENRLGSTGKNGRHQRSPARQQRVSDRVDPLVHAVQAPCFDPLVHDTGIQPQLNELEERHDPVLTRRKARDRPVRPAFESTGRFSSIWGCLRPVGIHRSSLSKESARVVRME